MGDEEDTGTPVEEEEVVADSLAVGKRERERRKVKQKSEKERKRLEQLS